MSLSFLSIKSAFNDSRPVGRRPAAVAASPRRPREPATTGTARSLAALLLLLTLLLSGVSGWAQGIPPRPNPPRLVNDFAGLLQPQEVAALEQKLMAYDVSTSSQFAIVTVPTLGDQEVAAYAQELFVSWGIGQAGKNNGLLLLVSVQPRKAWIQTGRGLEGAVPDALAKRIVSNTLAPAFQQKQYYAGFDRATDQLMALAKGEYKADPADARPRGQGRGQGRGPSFWVIIGILMLLFWFMSRRNNNNRGGRGGLGGMFIPPIIFGDFSGGRGVFGGGGGGGGGGGFGGFGGGDSGGGGAGGDW